MSDSTPVECRLDEAYTVGEQGEATRTMFDELMRSGRRRHDPTRSPKMLELPQQPQTTAALDLTDEQLEAVSVWIRSRPGYRPNVRPLTATHTLQDVAAAAFERQRHEDDSS